MSDSFEPANHRQFARVSMVWETDDFLFDTDIADEIQDIIQKGQVVVAQEVMDASGLDWEPRRIVDIKVEAPDAVVLGPGPKLVEWLVYGDEEE